MTPSPAARRPLASVASRRNATLAMACLLAWSAAAIGDDAPVDRLLLVTDGETRQSEIEVGVKKPFDVLLVAERDIEEPRVATVVFQLELPEGVLLVGEEILVESLIALGTPRTGINLAFQCVEAASVPVMRFRFVATQPLTRQSVRLVPDSRTSFRGIVTCKEENYDKFGTPPDSLTITAR